MFMLIAASQAAPPGGPPTGKSTWQAHGVASPRGKITWQAHGKLTARVQGQRMVLVNWMCDKPDAPKDLFPCMFSEHLKTTRAITDAAQRKAANEKWSAYLKTSKAKQSADFWKMHDTYCAQSKPAWSISQVVSAALRSKPVSQNPTKPHQTAPRLATCYRRPTDGSGTRAWQPLPDPSICTDKLWAEAKKLSMTPMALVAKIERSAKGGKSAGAGKGKGGGVSSVSGVPKAKGNGKAPKGKPKGTGNGAGAPAATV